MTSIRRACRPDLLLIIVIAIGTFGCAGGAGSTGGSGAGGGGGGSNPPPSVQLWSGILDTSRAVDWSSAGVPGGIPNRTTQCGPAVNASGDTSGEQDVTNVNTAIQNCYNQPNTVVQLGSGTFYNCGGWTFGSPQNPNGYTKLVNNVTLRGSGPLNTIVKVICPGQQELSGAANGIGVAGKTTYNPLRYAGSHLWMAGYTKGTNTITLDSVSGLSAGMIILLDQRNDDIGLLSCTESGTTATCQTSVPHNFTVNTGATCPDASTDCVAVGDVNVPGYNTDGVTAITAVPDNTHFSYSVATSGLPDSTAGGYAGVDTGGTRVTGINHGTIDEHLDLGRQCPDSANPACQTNEISWRSQNEVKKIVSVNSSTNQITLDSGLYHNNWRSSQNPGIWWMDASPTSNYSIGDGIENMTIDACADGGSDSNSVIEFYRAYGSWVKNIRGLCGDRNFIWIRDGSAHIQVQDSYIGFGKGAASQSYDIEAFGATADHLFINNIFQHTPSGLMFGGAWGAVGAYNYMWDDGWNTVDILMNMMDTNHDVNGFNLLEGNDFPSMHAGNAHGTITGSITYFRNRARGQTSPPGPVKSNGLDAAQFAANNRGINVIGGVLGWPDTDAVGGQTQYQQLGTFTSGYVYSLNKTAEVNTFVPNDPLVQSTLLRWGNYDVVTGAVRWCGTGSEPGCGGTSEIPVAFTSINANPVPSNHDLPNSFFLSSAPAFWPTHFGTPQWPPIGPDVVGGNAPDGLNGMADSIPSQLCADNLPLDSNYLVPNTVTGASWSAGPPALMTLTGTFTSQLYDTFKMSGMVTSGPGSGNGNFQIYWSNGPITPYQPLVTAFAGTSNPAGKYQIQVTLRQSGGGETNASSITSVALTAGYGNFQVAPPSEPPTQNGTGATAATNYGVYVSVPNSTKLCLQAFVPIGSTYTQNTPVQTSPCTTPPTANTAKATSITYMLNSDPGTYVSGGTIQSPLVLAYDAKSCYLN